MTFAALILSSFLACDLAVPPDTSLDSADTGNSELATTDDGGSDADVGGSGGDDTGTPTDTAETGDTSTPTDSCTSEDLGLAVDIRTEDGESISASVSPDQSLKVWAGIQNTCDNPVVYTTANRCLITAWRMENASGASVAAGTFPCMGRESEHTVAPQSTLEREVVSLHDLPLGTFKLIVTWGGEGDNERSKMLNVAR